MTFCFAFRHPTHGIGVIADSRLTIGRADTVRYEDGFQKIIPLSPRCFITIAGDLSALGFLTACIPSFVASTKPRHWQDNLLAHLASRWKLGVEVEPTLKGRFAQLLYGDVTRVRGHARYRLKHLEFGTRLLEDGRTQPTVGHNMKPLESRGIGGTESLRKRLSRAGQSALSEIVNGSFMMVEQPAEPHGHTGEFRYLLDRTQGIDFFEDARRFDREYRRRHKAAPLFSGMHVLISAAQKAIVTELEQATKEKETAVETIGGNWSAMILQMPEGMRFYTNAADLMSDLSPSEA